MFGEGSEIIINEKGETEIFMLTWRDRVIYVFDKNLLLKRQLVLPQMIKEGWGITQYLNSTTGIANFIVSDGTNFFYHVDTSFNIIKRV